MLEAHTADELLPSGNPPLAPQKVAPVDPDRGPVWRSMPVSFRGEGRVYFGIWVVNLLLILVTVGFYYPWAKYRRLKYFHQHTFVDGHAFDFLAKPTQMLRGYLIGLVVFGAYYLSSQWAPMLGLGILAFISLALPWALRSSRRFYLAHTRWRGLRFAFTGSIKNAYWALMPTLLLGYALAAIPVLTMGDWTPEQGGLPPGFALSMGTLLVFVLVAPTWTLFKINQYLNDHFAWGKLNSRFDAKWGDFVKLGLKTLGAAVLTYFVVLALIGGIVGIGVATVGRESLSAAVIATIGVGFFVLMVAVTAAASSVKSYFVSRLQNLVWGHTSAPGLKIESHLRWGPLWRLSIKNWCLMVCTLGLYWPFAVMALTRLRLESIQLQTCLDLDAQVSAQGTTTPGALGDALSDLFDVDVGL